MTGAQTALLYISLITVSSLGAVSDWWFKFLVVWLLCLIFFNQVMTGHKLRRKEMK